MKNIKNLIIFFIILLAALILFQYFNFSYTGLNVKATCYSQGYSCCLQGTGQGNNYFSLDNSCNLNERCWDSCSSNIITKKALSIDSLNKFFDDVKQGISKIFGRQTIGLPICDCSSDSDCELGYICDYGDGSSGKCNPIGGLCKPNDSKCGNGIIDMGEECDDGNKNDGDSCSSICKKEVPLFESGKCVNKPNLPDSLRYYICYTITNNYTCMSYFPICSWSDKWGCSTFSGYDCSFAKDKKTCEDPDQGYSKLCDWQDAPVDYSTCKLISGSGSSNNWKFVVIIEGKDDDMVIAPAAYEDKLKSEIEYGYLLYNTLKPYQDKINIYYQYAPPRILGCGLGASSSDAPDWPLIKCNSDTAKALANEQCGGYDEIVIIPDRFTSGRSNAGRPDFDPEIWSLARSFITRAILDPEGVKTISHSDVALSNWNIGVFWHELGHSFGGNIDYYMLPEVEKSNCENAGYSSMMCNSSSDFKTMTGDARNSYDAFLMVKKLNQKCDVKVSDYNRKISAFPVPASKGKTIKIPYGVIVPKNNLGLSSLCQVNAEIYNINGERLKLYTT